MFSCTSHPGKASRPVTLIPAEDADAVLMPSNHQPQESHPCLSPPVGRLRTDSGTVYVLHTVRLSALPGERTDLCTLHRCLSITHAAKPKTKAWSWNPLTSSFLSALPKVLKSYDETQSKLQWMQKLAAWMCSRPPAPRSLSLWRSGLTHQYFHPTSTVT